MTSFYFKNVRVLGGLSVPNCSVTKLSGVGREPLTEVGFLNEKFLWIRFPFGLYFSELGFGGSDLQDPSGLFVPDVDGGPVRTDQYHRVQPLVFLPAAADHRRPVGV